MPERVEAVLEQKGERREQDQRDETIRPMLPRALRSIISFVTAGKTITISVPSTAQASVPIAIQG